MLCFDWWCRCVCSVDVGVCCDSFMVTFKLNNIFLKLVKIDLNDKDCKIFITWYTKFDDLYYSV